MAGQSAGIAVQIPFGPWLALALIGAIAIATLHDLALLAGQALHPFFAWMYP